MAEPACQLDKPTTSQQSTSPAKHRPKPHKQTSPAQPTVNGSATAKNTMLNGHISNRISSPGPSEPDVELASRNHAHQKQHAPQRVQQRRTDPQNAAMPQQHQVYMSPQLMQAQALMQQLQQQQVMLQRQGHHFHTSQAFIPHVAFPMPLAQMQPHPYGQILVGQPPNLFMQQFAHSQLPPQPPPQLHHHQHHIGTPIIAPTTSTAPHNIVRAMNTNAQPFVPTPAAQASGDQPNGIASRQSSRQSTSNRPSRAPSTTNGENGGQQRQMNGMPPTSVNVPYQQPLPLQVEQPVTFSNNPIHSVAFVNDFYARPHLTMPPPNMQAMVAPPDHIMSKYGVIPNQAVTSVTYTTFASAPISAAPTTYSQTPVFVSPGASSTPVRPHFFQPTPPVFFDIDIQQRIASQGGTITAEAAILTREQQEMQQAVQESQRATSGELPVEAAPEQAIEQLAIVSDALEKNLNKKPDERREIVEPEMSQKQHITQEITTDPEPITQTSQTDTSVPVDIQETDVPVTNDNEMKETTPADAVKPVHHQLPPIDTSEPDVAGDQLNKESPVLSPAAAGRSWAAVAKSKVQSNSNNSSNGSPASQTPKSPESTTAEPTQMDRQNSFPIVNGYQEENNEPRIVWVQEDSSLSELQTVLTEQLTLKHSGPAYVVRGMHNMGKWCYANAVLQSLQACPPFFHLFHALNKFATRRRSSMPVVDMLSRFVVEFLPKDGGSARDSSRQQRLSTMPVNPDYINACIQQHVMQQAQPNQQQDAQEFLINLLNAANDEMVAVLDASRAAPPDDADDTALTESTNDGWREVITSGKKNTSVVTRHAGLKESPISKMFVGQSRQGLARGTRVNSMNTESFWTLSLDVNVPEVRKITDAINHTLRPEKVKARSDKTSNDVDATRTTSLVSLPVVLVLHLKLFIHDRVKTRKLDKLIEFDQDVMIDRNLMRNSPLEKAPLMARKYKLFAVVLHHGAEAATGHYTAIVFHAGKWLHIDDTRVEDFGNRQPMERIRDMSRHSLPYMLFYRRMDLITTNYHYHHHHRHSQGSKTAAAAQ